MESNMLLVSVLSARGMYLKGHSSMDALVTVTMHGKGSMRSRAVTETIHSSGDATWDEHMEFKIVDPGASMTICAQHKSRIGRNDIIGRVELSLEDAKNVHGDNWFPLRKKSGEDKYRGELLVRFLFRYEKSNLSVSNQSLNTIQKDSMMDKLKGKIKLSKLRHKSDPDGMSIASGVSAMSGVSSFSKVSKGGTLARFGFGKKKDKELINNSFAAGMNRSSTLPPPAMSQSMENAYGGEYLSPQSNPPAAFQRAGSRRFHPRGSANAPMSHSTPINTELKLNGSSNNLSHMSGHNPFSDGHPSPIMMAPASPSVSTAESFHRPPSVASSGFGSNHRHQNSEDSNRDDLLSRIDKLEMELRVKDSRMRDMEQYLDDLLSRVMIKCPDVLAAPKDNGLKTNRSRFFSTMGF